MKISEIDSLIFDMDGTVWDNTVLFADAWNKVMEDEGLPHRFDAARLRAEFGKTMTAIADSCLPELPAEERYRIMRKCEDWEMQDLIDLPDDTCYDGLVSTLRQLSQRLPLFIVSNCQCGYIEIFIDKNQGNDYITDFLCFGDTGLTKDGTLKILCEKHGLQHPYYVGDIQADKDACDKAGVNFIWASYGYGASVVDPDAIISKPSELLELIQ